MSDKTYNAIRTIAEVILPAVGTLYFALASIWGLPYAEQIVGTVTAVDAFLGAVIAINRESYNSANRGDPE